MVNQAVLTEIICDYVTQAPKNKVSLPQLWQKYHGKVRGGLHTCSWFNAGFISFQTYIQSFMSGWRAAPSSTFMPSAFPVFLFKLPRPQVEQEV